MMLFRAFGLLLLLCQVGGIFAAEPTPEQLTFFENKIRPVLANTCYECHSLQTGKTKAGLALDTKDGLQKGGNTGPAIVSGDPEKSLLLKAIRGDDPDSAMPPKGARLTKEQVADFAAWIKMGAPDPRTGPAVQTAIDKLFERGAKHWAFQPIQEPAPPAGEANPIDAFIAAKLKEKGIAPVEPADKRTLIRRATFDLIGLPPTKQEVDAFLADSAPDAFEKLIDRLLASPQYGERWGRHWLDVARYADTMGAIYNGDDVYPYAYSYRDYVIHAFNADLPYDRFIQEQIAADLLEKDPSPSTLAAQGFITLGRRKDRNVDDEVYDDRIDTISRGLLGMTVSCARCHDHKLEPIRSKDYYGLAAIFRSSTEPPLPPEIKPDPITPEYTAFVEERAKLRKALVEKTAGAAEIALHDCWADIGDYFLAAVDGKQQKTTQNNKLIADILKPRKLNDSYYNTFIDRNVKWFEANKPIFALWVEVIALKEEDRAAKLPEIVTKHAGDAQTNARLVALLKEKTPTNLKELSELYSRLFHEVYGAALAKAQTEFNAAMEVQKDDEALNSKDLEAAVCKRMAKAVREAKLDDVVLEALRVALNHKDAPTNVQADKFRDQHFFSEEALKHIDAAAKAWKELEGKHAGAPPRAMALKEGAIYEGKVFLRGNPSTLGDPAPRRFVEILGGPQRPTFPKDKSGRLELAQAITSPQNPLTARVFVNRVWGWHFGKGLVRTPSDFGLRGEAPTHPELLDYLAARFMKEGWSIKKLHKLIMLSATYQRSSFASPDLVKADPENQYWARALGRNLEFEAYRDAQLKVAGRLLPAVGGRPVDLTRSDPTSLKRTVYGTVDRKSLPNLFRNFDFPDPNFSAATRTPTALTPQVLFMLNSTFVIDNARALAQAVKAAAEKDQAAGIRQLYQTIYQREPSSKEVERALAFLGQYPKNDIVRPEATDWTYGRGTYDVSNGTVHGFVPLAQYTGKAWQAGDKNIGNIALSADGGEPGKGTDTDAIRRWTAPLDGKIKIGGELNHMQKEGDGITARVVLNASKKLGEWAAKNTGLTTALENVEVKKGETVDFVVSGGKDPSADRFQWAPTITMVTAEIPGMPGMPRIWDAKTDFMDVRQMPKPLGPWEELSQILLISNEFFFID